MFSVDDKVNLQVKLQLLILKVFLLHVAGYEGIKRSEEFQFIAFVKAGLDLQK